MKYAFFYDTVFPTRSATSVRAYYCLQALVNATQLKDEIVVVTGTNKPEQQKGIRFISTGIEKNHNKQPFYKRAFYELLLGLKSSYILRKERPDKLLISSPSYIAAIIVAITAKLLRIKYIFEVRDTYPEAYNYVGVLSESGWITNCLSKINTKIFNSADFLVSATLGIKNHLQEKYDSKGILNIYNGFPENIINIRLEKFPDFTVVFHGTLGLFQNVNLLIDIAEKLEPYEINVLVIGHGSKSEDVEIAAKKHKNINFLGSLIQEKTLEVVSKCHLGLSFRNDDELSKMSFPIKNWEYFGLGIPAIVTPKGTEAGLFLQANDCGAQYDNDDVESILDYILRIKNDKEIYHFLHSNCIKLRDNHTREKYAVVLASQLISNSRLT